jgi:hypothetical protein
MDRIDRIRESISFYILFILSILFEYPSHKIGHYSLTVWLTPSRIRLE